MPDLIRHPGIEARSLDSRLRGNDVLLGFSTLCRCIFQATRFLLVVAALGLALCVPAATEEEASGSDEESWEMGEIVVRAPRIREAADDPASSVTVITADDFAFEFKTAPEVIAQVPGIKIRQYGGLGQLSTVSIRGSSSEQVLVLLDGVPMNTGQGGGVDFSTIPLDAVERIEVVRGGGTAVYGPDAIGGVVNIVTKPAGERPQAQAGMSFGSYDTFKTFSVVRGAVRDVGLLFSATHMQSHGDYTALSQSYQAGGETLHEGEAFKRINNDFRSENLLAKADWDLSERWAMGLTSDLVLTDRGQPGMSEPGLQLAHARQRVLGNVSTWSLTGEDAPFDAVRTTLRFSTRFNRIEFRNPEPNVGYDPIDTRNDTLDLRGSLRFDRDWQWAWGGNYLTLVSEASRQELRDEVSGGQEGYGRPARGAVSATLQNEWVLFERKLSLIPVLRVTHTDDFGTRISPKLGMICRPLWWLSVKGNVESSYRPPNFSELYYPDQGYIRGNPELSPEEALNWDVGAVFTLDRLFAEIIYFRRDVENLIYWLQAGPYTIMPQDTGPADFEGVEVAIESRPFLFFNISANYTFLRAISNTTGEQLAGNPVHTANGSLSLIHRIGEVGVDVRYLDRIPLFNDGRAWIKERVQTDFSIRVDVAEIFPRGPGRMFRRAVVAFQVKNVGDLKSADTRGFTLPGRTFFGTVTLEY